MNLFEIDYTKQTTALINEALKFKKYKAMNPVLAIFTGIFMIPIVIIDAILAVALYVLGFIFNLLASPIKFIHDVLRSEGKDIKHATQFIVYLISWPVVFFAYVILSATVLVLSFLYALVSIFAYIWSLGGFRFHVNASEADSIEITVSGRSFIIPLIYIIASAVIIFCLPLIRTIIFCIDYDITKFEYILSVFKGYTIANVIYSILFSIAYSAIFFGARNVKKADFDENSPVA